MKRILLFSVSCLLTFSLWAVNPSGTLPVVHITTSDGQGITDKDNYKAATIYIDPLSTGQSGLGSAGAPIAAQVKGRGNWTWNGFDKKPYKIKFEKKQTVFGMPKNKHWVLLAGADDWLGYLKNPVGFMLSKAIGLRWTPGLVPVELIINGNYQGLYFLVEHVRVDPNRVNITELTDNETDPSLISGGWLVEIDNYETENNIMFHEGNGQKVMISLDSPETLSVAQREYIDNQMLTLNNTLYGDSYAQLEAILDIEEAAKYYLVQEIMEDCESYHGSCKLYKDRDGADGVDKWKFGPVWDFGNAYDRHAERWIYDGPTWPQYWIGQLATWPEFQKAVKEQWWIFYHYHKNETRQLAILFANNLVTAAKRDAQVWNGTQNYCNNSNMQDKLNTFLSRYDWRINWLYEQWGEGIQPVTWDIENTENETVKMISRKIIQDGQIRIIRDDKTYDLLGNEINHR